MISKRNNSNDYDGKREELIHKHSKIKTNGKEPSKKCEKTNLQIYREEIYKVSCECDSIT